METKSKAVVLFRLMQISQDPECCSKYSELLRAWIQNSVTFEGIVVNFKKIFLISHILTTRFANKYSRNGQKSSVFSASRIT